ncbi:MAG: protein-glutamate O-methyltransferase CheR [Bdellovibrionaceae bacterium]|nr:protein-glutamate O-methyltransferase CheR [Pseudobdellovibrionaceae bacterium]
MDRGCCVSAAKNINFEDFHLSQETYLQFAGHIYKLAGVNLPYNSKNEALVKNRLARILRAYNQNSFEEYWKFLKSAGTPETQEFISALTTNMTSFFREAAHFTWFGKAIKTHFEKLYSARIWCAAASTGQEPYTIAITVCENLPEKHHARVKILASDIDTEVLKKGGLGYYKESEMGGLSRDIIFKYFDRTIRDGDVFYRVKDFLRDMVQFSQFNLVDQKYEFKKPFDFVFCRNVLIYFDEKTVGKVVENLSLALNPGGYLLLGHSESGNIKNALITSMSKAIYQRNSK